MNYQSLITKNKLILFLSFFFLIRIIYSYFFGYQELGDGDAPSYSGYALAILNQADWLTNPDFVGHYRPPFYPIFLAAIYFVFGAENLFAVYFFQAIISTLTVYYIFKLSASIFGEKMSYLSLIWAGFYFYYIFYVGAILRETLIYFLIIFSFYHLCVFLNKKEHTHFLKKIDLWEFIIAFTILFHTDARYLFYIPFISILFVIYKNFWAGIKQYLWVLGILILLVIPWSIRNYISYDGIVLINTRTLDMRQSSSIKHLKRIGFQKEKVTTRYWSKNYPTEEERQLIKKGHNPNNRSENEIDAILNDRYPTRNEIEKRWYYFKILWRPYHFVNEYMPWPDGRFDKKYSIFDFGIVKAISYGTLLPFMIFSMIYVIIRRQKDVSILILPILVQTILHILMWGLGRYRVPIDSFVIILGCYGMVVIYDFINKQFKPKLNLIRKKSTFNTFACYVKELTNK